MSGDAAGANATANDGTVKDPESSTSPRSHFEDHLVVSPWRWLTAVLLPIFMAFWGLRRKSVDISGAILGLFVGFVLTLSSFSHVACLFAFLVSSTKATKFRATEKKKIEADFKEGGQRNWVQILCNGGMATQLALLYLLDVGNAEQPIDFDKYYRSSWLSVGILGAFACCNGDIGLHIDTFQTTIIISTPSKSHTGFAQSTKRLPFPGAGNRIDDRSMRSTITQTRQAPTTCEDKRRCD
ncbi:hypothetical protein K0M31_003643 [Melipona bicolor]|uniref:Transmembrane protein 19 n=1 Tax=Melipona bicolor TaxID=60889 RepID=A0AA40KPR0_9HYME|nr:hypothetical protein K0M31_003643 [Melipona bicolor]